MQIESLLFAIAVAWGIWVLMRIHRKRRNAGPAAPRPAPAEAAPRSMPRMGTPGTITFNQIQALRRHGFVPDKGWSCEEAALILDAVSYLRAVCRAVAGEDDGPPPIEIQNELLRLILTDQDLRDYVRRWGEQRRDEGLDDDDEAPEPAHNDQFARVARAAAKYLTG